MYAGTKEKFVKSMQACIVLKNEDLFAHIDDLQPNNAQNEYYLTDMVSILANLGKKVNACVIEDRDEVMGINDCVELK